MRIFAAAGLLLALVFSSCSTQPVPQPRSETAHPPVARPAEIPVMAPAEIAVRPAVSHARTVTRSTISGIDFVGISFDSNGYRLAVVDQAAGPGSRFADAQSAAKSRNAIAATNAGFFTPEGLPLGKVIAGGKSAGSWNRASSLGSGVFYETAAGNPGLARRESVTPGSHRELLQAGPMLIENGRGVEGLNGEKSAVRIFILWDGGSQWWLGYGSSCTLAELGKALATGSPAGFPIRSALNLDGGRSADLWISGSVAGGPVLERAIWNRPVRNFLTVVAR